MANPAAPAPVAPEQLALQRLYHWEKTSPGRVILTQPLGGGAIRNFTWGEAMGEVRRMAAHLRSLGFPPGSRIALLSKNTAHWLLADFAIWMAGHVSVPLYPTLAAGTIRQILEHSESRLLFVGKLDGWEAMRPGVPEGLPCIGLPLAPPNDYPQWDAIVAATAPMTDSPVRDGNELSTLMYTSGTTGTPKGVMHSFATFAWSIATGPEAGADRQRAPGCSATCRSPTWPSAPWSSTRCWPPACTCSSPRASRPSRPTCSGRGRPSSSRCRACGSSSSRRSARRCRRRSCSACCAFRSCAGWSRRRSCAPSASTPATTPPAARRRCRPSCCAGMPASACRSPRPTA